LKLKTWFAAAALAVVAACSGDSTGSGGTDIGPPAPLPAGVETVTTASGLKYADITVGIGAVAQASSKVSAHYTVWLSDGTGIETSRGGSPVGFDLASPQLIAGFRQGIPGMKEGGKRRLIVPPSLGYGSQPQTDGSGRVIIPANSTLIFDIELVAVTG
jgi:FKBP-type peptidyl-prolyl cis-trans isomerase